MNQTDRDLEALLSICALLAKMTPTQLIESIDWEEVDRLKKEAQGEDHSHLIVDQRDASAKEGR